MLELDESYSVVVDCFLADSRKGAGSQAAAEVDRKPVCCRSRVARDVGGSQVQGADSSVDDSANCHHSRAGYSTELDGDDTSNLADDSPRASLPRCCGCSR